MNGLVTVLAVLECLSSTFCILLYCFIIYILTTTKLYHSLFRTTFRIFSVCVVVSMTIDIYLVITCLLQAHFSIELMTAETRVSAQIAQGISVYAYWLAFTSVSTERAFATVFAKTYERRYHSTAAQFRLILIFLSVFTMENISAYLYPNATLAFVCGFETNSCLVILYVIRAVNRRNNRVGSADLSTRFQVKENVLLSSSMFPLMAMCFVWQLALLPLVGVQLTATEVEHRDLATALLQCGSSLFLLSYAVGFVQSAAMRKALRSTGIVKGAVSQEMEPRVDENVQYEQWMATQRAMWRVD